MASSFDTQRIRAIFDECFAALELEEASACLCGGTLMHACLDDGTLLEQGEHDRLLLELSAAHRSGENWLAASAATEDLSPDGVLQLASAVRASLRPVDTDPRPPAFVAPSFETTFDSELAKLGPAARIDTLLEPHLLAQRKQLRCRVEATWTLGGVAFDGSLLPFAFANSHGDYALAPHSGAQLLAWCAPQDQPLLRDFACQEGTRREQLDPARLLEASFAAWENGASCVSFEALPRPMSLLLDAPASAALFEPILNHLTTLEPTDWGRRFLLDRQFVAPVELRSDAAHPLFRGVPFDATGTTHGPVDLLLRGLLVSPPTHALRLSEPAPGVLYPVVEGTQSTLEELLAGVSAGVLLREIWLDTHDQAPELELLAPHGGWSIVDGQLGPAVAPFRLRTSYDDLFGAQTLWGTPRRALSMVVPPICIQHFQAKAAP